METNRFNRAISALVDAFFNDTLAKGNCSACAVGNIVAAAYGKKLYNNRSRYLCDIDNYQWWYFLNGMYEDLKHRGFQDILVTGYSIDNIRDIEKAFENNTTIHFNNYQITPKEEIIEDQYNGLMAVVDVLCEIEGIEDKQEYKQMFEYV